MRAMFHVVLLRPEIPPNTGNVIRLCANTGARLHLVHPLGFRMDDADLKRAGLDYHEHATVEQHPDLATALARLQELGSERAFYFTGQVPATPFGTVRFVPGDAFVFGQESSGLPAEVLAAVAADRRIRLPMRPGQRSLNLSNAVAVVVFEAWRQQGYAGGG
jgi:tRNA (cytidine/uridine-2'-O-)-methyltransferase